MKTSAAGISLIKKFEGCKLSAYVDVAGVLTIGYGHTGKDVVPGLTITQMMADALLVTDLEKFEAKVMKYDPIYHWTQPEFDALVSFAYNIGSIDALTDNGKRDRQTIRSSMLMYRKAGGHILPGLEKRRNLELRVFNTDIH